MMSPPDSNPTLPAGAVGGGDRYPAPSQAARAQRSAAILKQVRRLHLYLGVFFAPAILFFSLTGGAQVLNLHETQRGSTYQPPVWLEKLAQVHKKQTLEIRSKAAPRANNNPQERRGANPPAPLPAPTGVPRPGLGVAMLKFFSLIMSLGLTFTTALGLYLAFKYNRDRRLVWGLLVAGTAIPVVLLLV